MQAIEKIYASVTGVSAEAVANASFPVLMERNVSLGELRYLPLELFELGFTRSKNKHRFNNSPIVGVCNCRTAQLNGENMKLATRHRPLSLTLALFLVTLTVLSGVPTQSSAADLACAQPAKAPKDLGTLVIANKPDHAPSLQWGIDQGCFKKYGLTVKNEIVASNPVATAGLVSGTYDLIVSSPTQLVQLMTNGDFQVKIIAPRYGYTAAQLARAKQEPLYPG